MYKQWISILICYSCLKYGENSCPNFNILLLWLCIPVVFLCNKKTCLLFFLPLAKTLSIADFITEVEAVTGIHDREIRLLFGNREIVDTDCLGDYPGLGDNSTISITSRLFGGSRHIDPTVRRSKGPCVVTGDNFDIPQCVVMSCSHAIDPVVLYEACQMQVLRNKMWEVHCPSCNKVWPLSEILQCGVTREEIQGLVKGMSENWCMKNKSVDILATA